MNGALYHICSITVAAKQALKSKEMISYTPLEFEGDVTFQFLPQKKWLGKKGYTALDRIR